MKRLTVLTQAELDAVSGGNFFGDRTTVIRSFGSGGSGGAIGVGVGGNATATGLFSGSITITSTNSTFNASGGTGSFQNTNGSVSVG